MHACIGGLELFIRGGGATFISAKIRMQIWVTGIKSQPSKCGHAGENNLFRYLKKTLNTHLRQMLCVGAKDKQGRLYFTTTYISDKKQVNGYDTASISESEKVYSNANALRL